MEEYHIRADLLQEKFGFPMVGKKNKKSKKRLGCAVEVIGVVWCGVVWWFQMLCMC